MYRFSCASIMRTVPEHKPAMRFMAIVATLFKIIITGGHGICNMGEADDRFVEGRAHRQQSGGFHFHGNDTFISSCRNQLLCLTEGRIGCPGFTPDTLEASIIQALGYCFQSNRRGNVIGNQRTKNCDSGV